MWKYDIEHEEIQTFSPLPNEPALNFKDAFTVQVGFKLFSYTLQNNVAQLHAYTFINGSIDE